MVNSTSVSQTTLSASRRAYLFGPGARRLAAVAQCDPGGRTHGHARWPPPRFHARTRVRCRARPRPSGAALPPPPPPPPPAPPPRAEPPFPPPPPGRAPTVPPPAPPPPPFP